MGGDDDQLRDLIDRFKAEWNDLQVSKFLVCVKFKSDPRITRKILVPFRVVSWIVILGISTVTNNRVRPFDSL